MRTRFVRAALLLALVAATVFARTDEPKPAPELRKLDYFVGTWAAQGEIRPGPLGAGGRFTGTNRVQWMDGGFFLVTQSDFEGAMGKGSETSYMGWDADTRTYTYDSFNTLGEVDRARGTVNGDTWTWLSETKIGEKTMKGRLTQKVRSPAAYDFRFETSFDGKTWTTMLEGSDAKK
jgi:hypothetical protein